MPKSYVGYYADLDGDEEPDGIIYADLAVGGSGSWGYNRYGTYEYSAVTSGLKNYYISDEYDGVFGKKGVLTADGEGEQDRFYVMDLKDTSKHIGTAYTWYAGAMPHLGMGLDGVNTVDGGTNNFGQGKVETENVFANWKVNEWGVKNSEWYIDIWGVIENEISAGWFVPSKSEWGAFGDYLYKNCGVTTSNYSDFGLASHYWSSTQADSRGSAFYVIFANGWISNSKVDGASSLRLSVMF